MRKDVSIQIVELQETYQGLSRVVEKEEEIILSGTLHFVASSDGLETITDSFDIELIIPFGYPKELPSVYETNGKIDSEYEHVFENGKLCLAIPIEERRLFRQEPTLLGFIDRLLIPYLYGYCYWRVYKKHPFDESEHGLKGIVQYYRVQLRTDDELSILAAISYLYEYRYRGHHLCPCGSGKKVRYCHAKELRELNDLHTEETLKHDFIAVLSTCMEIQKAEKIQIPDSLARQISRIIKNKKLQ